MKCPCIESSLLHGRGVVFGVSVDVAGFLWNAMPPGTGGVGGRGEAEVGGGSGGGGWGTQYSEQRE